MKILTNLKIKLLGKPQRATVRYCDPQNQKITSVEQAQNEATNQVFWFGRPGTGFKKRWFPASEFRLDWVPRYVQVIAAHTNPTTGERCYGYVDTYGKKDPYSVCRAISWLFAGELPQNIQKEGAGPDFLDRLGVVQRRGFEETEFDLEQVPDYVHAIRVFVDPETGKRCFTYVDTCGKENPEILFASLTWLFLKEINQYSNEGGTQT